jgi:hypothetical protein
MNQSGVPSSAPATRDRTFRAHAGLPDDWDEQSEGVPASLTSRWTRLAEGRIAGGLHTFGLYEGDRLSIGFCGGILPEPGDHPRFDPYMVLSGASAATDISLAPDGPHPWKDADPSRFFPCCLIMFPNYETAPAGRGAHDPVAAEDFIAELSRWSQDNGVRSIAYLYLRSDHPEFCTALRSNGFELIPMIDRCDMRVTWSDFDGYLGTLTRNRRTSVRRERREIRSRGIVISERKIADDESEIVRLRCKLLEKYGATPDPEREAFSLRYLRDHFGADDLLVIEARAAERLLAFSLFICDGDFWTVLMNGEDYDDPAASFTYFETMFYRPAELAALSGVHTIGYGIGTIAAKRSRGCATRTLYAAVKVNEPR